MPGKIGPDKRRAVFIADAVDYETLQKYAKKMDYSIAVMLREATYRLAKQLREEKQLVLLRVPHENEGSVTETPRGPRGKYSKDKK